MKKYKLIEPQWHAKLSLFGLIVAVTVAPKLPLACILVLLFSFAACFTIYVVNMRRIAKHYTMPVVIRKLRESERCAIQAVAFAHTLLSILLGVRYAVFFWN